MSDWIEFKGQTFPDGIHRCRIKFVNPEEGSQYDVDFAVCSCLARGGLWSMASGDDADFEILSIRNDGKNHH